MTIRICSAKPDDAFALSRFECRTWDVPENKYSYWTWVLGIRYHTVLKAMDGAKLVGVASMQFTSSDAIYIDEVIVHKKYRNRGIATRLLNELIHKAGTKKLVALTWTTNKASRHLLKKNGFKKVRNVGNLFGNPKKVYWEFER